MGWAGGAASASQHPSKCCRSQSCVLCCDLAWGQSRGSRTCPSSTEPRPHSSTGSHPPGTRSGQAHGGTSGGNSRTCSWSAAARSTLQGQPGHTPRPQPRGAAQPQLALPGATSPGSSRGPITVPSSRPAVCLSLCAVSHVRSTLCYCVPVSPAPFPVSKLCPVS